MGIVKLEIDSNEIEKSYNSITSAVETFSSWNGKAFEDDIEKIRKMNSDFAENLARVLEVTQDFGEKTLVTNMKNYAKDAKNIKETFDDLNQKAKEVIEQ